MTDPTDLTKLAAILAGFADTDARVTYYKHARDATRLNRIGRAAARLASQECTIPMNDADQARAQKRRDKWHAEAAEILADYGVDPETISVSNDPRGFGIKWQFQRNARGFRPGTDFGDPNVWGIG